MSIDIRNNIKENFTGAASQDFKSAIEESIAEKKEITLPGMGVFFETVWMNSNQQFKNDLLQILVNYYRK